VSKGGPTTNDIYFGYIGRTKKDKNLSARRVGGGEYHPLNDGTSVAKD